MAARPVCARCITVCACVCVQKPGNTRLQPYFQQQFKNKYKDWDKLNRLQLNWLLYKAEKEISKPKFAAIISDVKKVRCWVGLIASSQP
jgi:hypothetical protein